MILAACHDVIVPMQRADEAQLRRSPQPRSPAAVRIEEPASETSLE